MFQRHQSSGAFFRKFLSKLFRTYSTASQLVLVYPCSVVPMWHAVRGSSPLFRARTALYCQRDWEYVLPRHSLVGSFHLHLVLGGMLEWAMSALSAVSRGHLECATGHQLSRPWKYNITMTHLSFARHVFHMHSGSQTPLGTDPRRRC